MTVTAFVLLLISSIIHAGWNMISKQYQAGLHSFITASFTGTFVLLPLLFFYWWPIRSMPYPFWLIVSGAGFFQALYYASLCAAYSNSDLSLVYPLVRSTPPLMVAGAALLLEGPQAISLTAAAGIVLVAGGGFMLPVKKLKEISLAQYLNKGSFFALTAGIATTGYSVLDDRGMRFFSSSPQGAGLTALEISGADLFLENAFSVIWLLIFLWAYLGRTNLHPSRQAERQVEKKAEKDRPAPMPTSKAMLMGIGIFVTYGLVLASMLFAGNVSYVVAFRQLGIIFSMILGVLFLGELGNRWKIGGSIVITVGLLLVALG